MNESLHDLFNRNLFLVTRMFDSRAKSFIKLILMKNGGSGLNVKNFCYRIEFQARGMPHIHGVIWLEKISIEKYLLSENDFEFDPKDILYFRIDRKKKLPITTILFALGFSKEKIINTFYSTNKYTFNKEKKYWTTDFIPENYKRPIKLSYDLIDSNTNKKVLGKGEKLNIVIAKKLFEKGLKTISITNEEIIGKYLVN